MFVCFGVLLFLFPVLLWVLSGVYCVVLFLILYFLLVDDCLESIGLQIHHWFAFTSNIRSIYASTPNFEVSK